MQLNNLTYNELCDAIDRGGFIMSKYLIEAKFVRFVTLNSVKYRAYLTDDVKPSICCDLFIEFDKEGQLSAEPSFWAYIRR